MKTPHSSRNFRVTKLLHGVVALALILTVAGTISLAGAETSYQYRSEPGDYIGGGGSNRYSSNSATISISGTSGYFSFSVNTATENWSVVLGAPAGELLHPGVYYNAERAAFRTGRSPGLDVYGDGRGCNQVYGSFAINQIETDASGTVILGSFRLPGSRRKGRTTDTDVNQAETPNRHRSGRRALHNHPRRDASLQRPSSAARRIDCARVGGCSTRSVCKARSGARFEKHVYNGFAKR